MKKIIKKTVSKFFPKGKAKEKIKCSFYNLLAKKGISYKILSNGVYETIYNGVSIKSINPLYNVVDDFSIYQNFYKVKPTDVVLDAGANVGYLSLLFSILVKEKGLVYAFEPDKHNIDKIHRNIRINDLKNNIIIEDKLLWNENVLVDFCESGSVASSAVWISDNDLVVKKEAVTIDSWVQKEGIEKLDFIKMDIEGAEIEALIGAKNVIKELEPNFAIASYHIVNNEPTFIKLEKFFESINYPYKTVVFKKNEIITFAGPCLNKVS